MKPPPYDHGHKNGGSKEPVKAKKEHGHGNHHGTDEYIDKDKDKSEEIGFILEQVLNST